MSRLRFFISTILAVSAAILFGGLFLAKPRPVSATPTPQFPTYVPGSFSFGAPQELIRPLNQVEGELDQSIEPEIKADLFGHIYITGSHGVPGGLDFWKSKDKGTSFIYMGQPDGAQDKCGVNGPVLCQNGLGGGDDSIDVSPDGYLYISSLWAGSVT